MRAIEGTEEPGGLRATSFGPDSRLRWDWETRRVHRIDDPSKYGQRFDPFAGLVRAFYGSPLSDKYEPGDYVQLSSLDNGRIGVAAFNSCFGNDCFAFHGHIPDAAIRNAQLGLRGKGFELLMAVWHHNVEGGPYASDYMDVDVVYRLIDCGFRLGLHGHQHRSQAEMRVINLPHQQPMALICAGSLCAGGRELPRGVNRQYNVVVLNDALGSVRVHVREIVVSTVFGPTPRAEFGGRSYIDLELPVPDSAAGERVREDQHVIAAEAAIQRGEYTEGARLLADHRGGVDSYERALHAEAIRAGRLWAHAAQTVNPPVNPEEFVVLVDALIQLDDFDEADGVIARFAPSLGIGEAVMGALRARIRAERQLQR